jgi:hypothetical protein
MRGTGSEPCPVTGFEVSGVEYSGTAITVLVNYLFNVISLFS